MMLIVALPLAVVASKGEVVLLGIVALTVLYAWLRGGAWRALLRLRRSSAASPLRELSNRGPRWRPRSRRCRGCARPAGRRMAPQSEVAGAVCDMRGHQLAEQPETVRIDPALHLIGEFQRLRPVQTG